MAAQFRDHAAVSFLLLLVGLLLSAAGQRRLGVFAKEESHGEMDTTECGGCRASTNLLTGHGGSAAPQSLHAPKQRCSHDAELCGFAERGDFAVCQQRGERFASGAHDSTRRASARGRNAERVFKLDGFVSSELPADSADRPQFEASGS
ncbi:unnamed protein product [Lampetra planeri]